jgi:hypothetical protein
MSLSKTGEIDRNLVDFLNELPSLLPEHEGEYALLRAGKILGLYPSTIDAQIAGNHAFEDEMFSIRQAKNTPRNVGHACY